MSADREQILASAKARVQQQDWRHIRRCADELLNRDPDDAGGFLLLGLAARIRGELAVAIEAFERAISRDANRYDAAIELANIHQQRGSYAEAAALLTRYSAAIVHSPYYLAMAGQTASRLGLHESAHRAFETAHRLQPEIEVFAAGLAAENVALGRIDAALGLYEQLVQRLPAHRRYHYELAMLRRATDRTHVDVMTGLLDAAGGASRNIFLYFAIGKELEDLGDWAQAFDFYKKGCDAAADTSGYSVQTDLAVIERIIATTTVSRPHAAPPADLPVRSPVPIFIVGLPRTGTTLLDRMLSRHPAVQSIGESHALQMSLKRAGRAVPAAGFSLDAVDAASRAPDRAVEDIYRSLVGHRMSGRHDWFIDKYPENLLCLGFAARVFPAAGLVLVRRNPMDTCFALYKQSYFRYAYRLGDVARYFAASRRLMVHWKSLLGDRVQEVRYEELVVSPESVLKALCSGIGLDFDPCMLDFETNDQPIFTASSAQVRKRLHTESVGKWRNFERQLQPLRDALEAEGVNPDE